MIRGTFAALAIVCSAIQAQAQAPLQPPVIVTQGDATVKRAPDRAWLSVAVETRDVRSSDARRKNAEAMTAVQTALKGAGVGADAIRTTGFSLVPEMDYANGRSTMRGYVARNQVEVRVDNLDKLSDVIDAVNTSKSDALSITGPRFDLKDEQGARNEALRLAVEVALSRARALADGARRTLGPILRVEDQNVPDAPRPMPMMMRAVAGAAPSVPTPITPGEIEVHAQVTVTFEMK